MAGGACVNIVVESPVGRRNERPHSNNCDRNSGWLTYQTAPVIASRERAFLREGDGKARQFSGGRQSPGAATVHPASQYRPVGKSLSHVEAWPIGLVGSLPTHNGGSAGALPSRRGTNAIHSRSLHRFL